MGTLQHLFSDRRLSGEGYVSSRQKNYEVLDLNYILESGYPPKMKETLKEAFLVLRAESLVKDSHPEAWWLIDKVVNELKPTWLFLPIESEKPFELNVEQLRQVRSKLSCPFGIFWKYAQDESAIAESLSKTLELPIYMKLSSLPLLPDVDFRLIHFIEFEASVSESDRLALKAHCDSLGISPVYVDGLNPSLKFTVAEIFSSSLDLLTETERKNLLTEFQNSELASSSALEDLIFIWPKFVRQSACVAKQKGLFTEITDFECCLLQTLRSPSLPSHGVGALDSLDFSDEVLARNPDAHIRPIHFNYKDFFERWWEGGSHKFDCVTKEPVLLGLSKSLDNQLLFTELNKEMAFVLDELDEGLTPYPELEKAFSQHFLKDDFNVTIARLRRQRLVL